MTTLFFCNLIPNKTGAFERVLTELGRVHSEHGDRLILVLAGAPIPEVAEWFRQAGVEWRVLSGWSEAGRKPDGGSLKPESEYGGIGVSGCRYNEGARVRPWRFVVPALRLLHRFKPDVAVVHFGNELPSLAVCLLAPLIGRRGIKWVWQQDQQISPPGWLAQRVSRIRLLGWRFDRFVTVYEGGRQSLVLRSIPQERVAVVYNGVSDPDQLAHRERARTLMGATEQTVLLMGAGSMILRKRQEFLLNALAQVAKGQDPAAVRLVLVGDGPERQRLEELAKAIGVESRVVFLGRRNDVSTLLCGADMFVHAAMAEGCAYVLAEAMAAGLPLVVTEAGAAREQVEDGVNGFVVASDDRRGFEQRLALLIGDVALRRRMGEASRKRWERLFQVEQQAQAYWEIYRGKREEVSGKR
jgi:glycosyltransferase involved in cell wall biosynthesis